MIRFNNSEDLPQPEENQKYICDPYGWDYIECFSAYGKVLGTNRTKWIYSSINNLICLNPNISKQEILSIAMSANSNRIYPRFSENEINNMVELLYYKNLETGLTPSTTKKKIIFNKAMNLSGKTRNKLSLNAIKENKRYRKQLDLYNIIESWDYKQNGKITQRSIISLKAGIGKKAVEKYYRDFKELISDINNEFNFSN